MALKINTDEGQIRVPKTAELVAQHLRRKIIRGELKEGDNLPAESALIEELGVSRPTMREAFRILEVENLITVSRGSRGGATVHLPKADVVARYAGHYLQARNTTIEDVYEARRIIEPQAVYLMAQRRPQDIIEEIKEFLVAQEENLDDAQIYTHYAAQVHVKFIEGSGNETLTLMAHVIHTIFHAHLLTLTTQKYDIKRAKEGIRYYRKVLQLIEEGEADKAQEQMLQQIDQSAKIALKNVAGKTIVDLIP